jgi:hypothetical protein|tara:strand:+ start:905 stop:1168 length:264 start_codon:yes stop_codon:yes gene_type:complete
MTEYKSSVDMGYGARQPRQKRDTVNLHLQLYDEEKNGDTYNYLMEAVGKYLRNEMGIVKKDTIKVEPKAVPLKKEKQVAKGKVNTKV